MTAPAPAVASAAEARAVRVAFAAIVLAMLPAVLDQTILGTALPTIAAQLGHLSDVSWVVTGYVVAAAAATPLWGKLGDRHGRRRLLPVSLTMFLAASAACGVAGSMAWLVVARMIQGLAAGGLMSLAMAAVGDLVPPRERARYSGYIAAAFATATVAGPLIGGLLVDHASWRWVFYVNLPVGLAALAGLRRLPRSTAAPARGPLDLAGAGLLAAATISLMLACAWGGSRYAWRSPTILAMLLGAAALSTALVLRERRAADPVVPVDLLRGRTVAVASAALFLATAALFAVNVFVPLFLQATTGASATEAGLLLVPMMLGITLSTNLAGRSIRANGRYRRYPIAGLALMSLALGALAVAAGHPSRLATGVALGVFGLGFGLVGQVLVVVVQNDVDRRFLGIAMATTSFFRGLGGALGAAALGAVFAARSAGAVLGGPEALHRMSVESRADLIAAIQAVFWCAAPIAVLGLLVALLLPEPRPDDAASGDGTGRPPSAAAPTRAEPARR